MQGFDPQTILPRIAAQGLERQEIRPGDWFDDDGMLMCGKCGEPRQGMVTVSAPMEGNPENKMTFKAIRSCKCDRDKEAAEKQAEQNKKDMERVARLKKASLMDEKLREASFDSFQVTKYNARNLKLCRRYAEAFDEMVSKNQGLIFWGSVGTGKSFAAACIANHLLNRGVPVMMTSLVKLLELIQEGCKKFALCHLSQENNTPALALQTVFNTLGAAGVVPEKDCIVQAQRRNEMSPVLEF